MFDLKTRILLCDDSATMRRTLKNILLKIGFTEILETENGIEGLEMLKSCKKEGNSVELLMSDWNMPQMAGIELLKNIRADEDFKTLPFIMVTTEGERKYLLEAIKNGVSNYILKPFTAEDILLKLEETHKKLSERNDSIG